jgi:anti-sigma regulatory factor (Ser/Thr protein kinase)
MTVIIPAQEGEAANVRLLNAQLDVLADVAAGVPLGVALAELLQVVEATSPDGVLGSVLLLEDDGGHLRHCAAPSLPSDYNQAIDGIGIGPAVGSCGTAAYTRLQVIVEDIQTDLLWAEFRDLAASAGLRACWSTPIIGSDGTLLGTFAMYYPQPQRPSRADIALIDVLVRTVTVAIERSRADEEREHELVVERTAALTLQHSLLPEVPPHIGAVRLEARYRTGDPGVEVGGDWFDAIDVDGGCVVVVGDVQGHDLAAAALMGQLRTVVRAYAAEGHAPSSILAGVNRYLSRLNGDLLATAVVVRLDPVARVATTATAGHLAPLLLAPTANGWSATEVEVYAGPPLGIGEEWPEHTTVIPDGAILLLYTDGLVETRAWPIEHGLTLLRTTLEALPPDADVSSVLDASLQLLPPGMRGDDVAVLAATAVPTAAETGTRARRWLPALPMAAPLARSWAHGLLRAWSVPKAAAEDAALVASELVTNAVRHSEEQVRLELALQTSDSDGASELLVEVFDRSHRLPQMHDITTDVTAGRGLHIIESLAKDWGVREELEGKVVWARLSTSRTT